MVSWAYFRSREPDSLHASARARGRGRLVHRIGFRPQPWGWAWPVGQAECEAVEVEGGSGQRSDHRDHDGAAVSQEGLLGMSLQAVLRPVFSAVSSQEPTMPRKRKPGRPSTKKAKKNLRRGRKPIF